MCSCPAYLLRSQTHWLGIHEIPRQALHLPNCAVEIGKIKYTALTGFVCWMQLSRRSVKRECAECLITDPIQAVLKKDYLGATELLAVSNICENGCVSEL